MDRTLKSLTGIRFIFALQIVFLHVALYTPYLDNLPRVLLNAVRSGYVGVDFFFALSGFILTYRYSGPGRFSWRDFYVSRFARIYPVYLVGILAFMPFWLGMNMGPDVTPGGGAGGFIASLGLQLSLTQAWIPAFALNGNFPGWSLSAEAFFYACFPLVGIWLNKCGFRGLIATAVVCYAVSILISALPGVYNVAGLGNVMASDFARAGDGFWTNFFRLNPLIRLPEFVTGMIACRIYFMRGEFFKKYSLALTGVGFAGIIAACALSAHIPFMLMHNGLLAPLAACMIAGLAGGGCDAVLGARPFLFLGEASYALYIVHIPIFFLLFGFVFPMLGASGPLLLCAYLALCVAAAGAVYVWVEVPLRRKIVRAFQESIRSPS